MPESTAAMPLDYYVAAQGTPMRTRILLAVMMFLQYAVWGVWLLLLPNYLSATPAEGGLGFTAGQIGLILGLALSIGAVTAPFIAGQAADRYLNAERALGLLLLVGGIVNFCLAYTRTYHPFLGLAILYSITYMPTLSLTNSVSFQNLRFPTTEFPLVRVAGTIGWIAASSLFPLLWLNTGDHVVNTARIADALKVSGAISIAYGFYCLTLLPKTPPKRDVRHPLAFARAFKLLAHPGFLVAVLVTLPISMIHNAFYFRMALYLEHDTGIALKYVGLVVSLGQWSEIVFLAMLGLLLKRLGFKGVLALGVSAYVLRFSIFAIGKPLALIVAAQALHGLCYGCYFAGAFLYVEKIAPKDIRHSAQTVFGIIILGIGPVAAGPYSAYFSRFTRLRDGVMMQDYRQFWWAQAAIALASLVILLLFFPRSSGDADIAEPDAP